MTTRSHAPKPTGRLSLHIVSKELWGQPASPCWFKLLLLSCCQSVWHVNWRSLSYREEGLGCPTVSQWQAGRVLLLLAAVCKESPLSSDKRAGLDFTGCTHCLWAHTGCPGQTATAARESPHVWKGELSLNDRCGRHHTCWSGRHHNCSTTGLYCGTTTAATGR